MPDDTPQRDAYDAQRSLFAGRPVRTIVDAGAYVGDTPVRYAELFPDADIHALEPSPDTFAQLERFTSALPRVRRHRLAVSDATGTRTLHLNGYDPTHSLLPRPAAGRRYYPAAASAVDRVTVPTITLDDFCAREHLDHVDVLKMDIQGAELLALRGAARLLREQRISVIYTEVAFVRHYEAAPLFCDLSQLLAAQGYSLYDLFLQTHAANGQLRYGDAIFVSDRFRADVIDVAGLEP